VALLDEPLHRNFVPAYFHIGLCKFLLGSSKETIPGSALAHFAKAQVLFAQNRCDDAVYEYETVFRP
jgi:hypothetical protein